jgi:N-acetylglucosaminyl-diphospho-decaprenol L-rhamnosyltransferase
MTPIAVVVINYNTLQHLRACLATVQSERPIEVVVVDNASSDGSVEMVRSEYPWVTLHANRKNLGYGAAANQGLASCTAPYVLLLNADTLLESGGLRKLSAYLDRHPRAAIVGPRLVNPDGSPQPSWFPFPSRYVCHTWITPPRLDALCGKSAFRRLIRYLPNFWHGLIDLRSDAVDGVVPWVLGAALAVRRRAFEAMQGFDESFFMYFEEVDLCYRLACAGWQVHFTPTTTIVHVGGVSTTQRRAAMMLQFFESEVQFYQRHYSPVLLLQFKIVVGMITLAHVAIDTVRVYYVRDSLQKARLAEDLIIWRSTLSSLCRPGKLHGSSIIKVRNWRG